MDARQLYIELPYLQCTDGDSNSEEIIGAKAATPINQTSDS
jgi:hypothetical protein